MTTYTVEPEQRTLHGSFSREFPPILTIDSGDSVRFRTLDVSWGLESRISRDAPRRTFTPRQPIRDDGHALCGPIAIRGAQPGMTLEVHINNVQPGTWGWTSAGGPNEDTRKLGIEGTTLLAWTLDSTTMIGQDQHGHSVALRPFMGILGMPQMSRACIPPLHPVFVAAIWIAKNWWPEASCICL